MRRSLTIAAILAAATLAATPAAALNVNAAEVQSRCADLTLNQIKAQLAEIGEAYELSNDPKVALEQIVSIICPSDDQTADADANVEETQARAIPALTYVPAPQSFGPPPSFGPPRTFGPQQRFAAPPNYGCRPGFVRKGRWCVPMHAQYAPQRHGPAPVYAHGPHRASAPGPHPRRPAPSRKPVYSEEGEKFCPALGSPEFLAVNGPNPMTLYPGRYVSCQAVAELPAQANKPCGGWACKRVSGR